MINVWKNLAGNTILKFSDIFCKNILLKCILVNVVLNMRFSCAYICCSVTVHGTTTRSFALKIMSNPTGNTWFTVKSVRTHLREALTCLFHLWKSIAIISESVRKCHTSVDGPLFKHSEIIAYIKICTLPVKYVYCWPLFCGKMAIGYTEIPARI